MKTIILAFDNDTASGLSATTYGPFDNFNAARDYGQAKLADTRWVIANLTDPETLGQQQGAGGVVHA